ncbi:hypothetical protein D3C87_770190 [compost metagenome]
MEVKKVFYSGDVTLPFPSTGNAHFRVSSKYSATISIKLFNNSTEYYGFRIQIPTTPGAPRFINVSLKPNETVTIDDIFVPYLIDNTEEVVVTPIAAGSSMDPGFALPGDSIPVTIDVQGILHNVPSIEVPLDAELNPYLNGTGVNI